MKAFESWTPTCCHPLEVFQTDTCRVHSCSPSPSMGALQVMESALQASKGGAGPHVTAAFLNDQLALCRERWRTEYRDSQKGLPSEPNMA